jgi:hypothetical protein
VAALTCLAFDVYSVLCAVRFPKQLLARLRQRRYFQGAAYELAVAATVARAGMSIAFTQEAGGPRCELVATSPTSGDSFGVEAKSRHRRGVLHEDGLFQPSAALKGDIGRFVREASRQAPQEMPFVVFIDLNSPLTPGVPTFSKPWFQDIVKELDAIGSPTPEKPDRWNAIAITNFAYHYADQGGVCPPGESVFIESRFPKYQLSTPDILASIRVQLDQHGQIPAGP